MQGPARPWARQLPDLPAASCLSTELKAVDVSAHMISAINTRVMLLGSNASKLVPRRGSIAGSEHLRLRGIQRWGWGGGLKSNNVFTS